MIDSLYTTDKRLPPTRHGRTGALGFQGREGAGGEVVVGVKERRLGCRGGEGGSSECLCYRGREEGPADALVVVGVKGGQRMPLFPWA